MKYLITGGNGQLGKELSLELMKQGYEVYAYGRDNMDIINKYDVVSKVLNINPDVIIHCAAYTNVNKAESDKDLCYATNVIGTENITFASNIAKCKLIYISTDYVFNGKKDGEYFIDDMADPINFYGFTKYKGELIAKKNPKHFIVRTSWVFGQYGKNFVFTMLDLAKTRKEISVVSDQIGSPTYTYDLAKLLIKMSLSDKYGTYHATNSGYCSWADFARCIFKINNIDIKVNDILTSDYISPANRPLSSKLNKDSIQEFGLLEDYEQAVLHFSKQIKKEI